LAEQSGNLIFIELAAELFFPLFDLRAQVFKDFRDDVVLLLPRQPEFNCVQVPVQ
jgi:hypothetical protein